MFCMRDSEDFLVMSEQLPSFKETASSAGDSSYVKHAYPFRPGLFALMKLGKATAVAVAETDKAEKSQRDALSEAAEKAEKLYAAGKGSDEDYYETIRGLRNAIRDLKGVVPQADNYYLNLFRQGGSF